MPGSSFGCIPGTQGFPAALAWLSPAKKPVALERRVPAAAPAVRSSDSAQAGRLFWGCKGLFLERGFFLLLACCFFFFFFAEVASVGQ